MGVSIETLYNRLGQGTRILIQWKNRHLKVTAFPLERVRGIEPLSSVWKTEIITIIRYPLTKEQYTNPKPLGKEVDFLVRFWLYLEPGDVK